jgi:hypothetical protein
MRNCEQDVGQKSLKDIFHQSGKGQKLKGVETKSGIKEIGIKERSIFHFVQNRKEA